MNGVCMRICMRAFTHARASSPASQPAMRQLASQPGSQPACQAANQPNQTKTATKGYKQTDIYTKINTDRRRGRDMATWAAWSAATPVRTASCNTPTLLGVFSVPYLGRGCFFHPFFEQGRKKHPLPRKRDGKNTLGLNKGRKKHPPLGVFSIPTKKRDGKNTQQG